MAYMLVTLDVSKLSGLLKADAPCRAESRAYAMWGEVHGSREVKERGVLAAAKAACTERDRLKAGGPGHARSAPRTWRSCL